MNLSCCYFLDSLLTVCIWEQAFNIWTDSFEVQFARSPVRYYMDEFRLWTQYAATWTEKKWNEENYDLADLPIVSAKIFLITYHSSWWTFFEPKFLCLIVLAFALKFMVKMTFQTRNFFKELAIIYLIFLLFFTVREVFYIQRWLNLRKYFHFGLILKKCKKSVTIHQFFNLTWKVDRQGFRAFLVFWR